MQQLTCTPHRCPSATLYSETQARQQADTLLHSVYGNPHSGNPSSEASAHAVAAARERVLRHFNVTPETHTVVFTSGATASLKIAAESYAFGSKGVFAYLRESHTSVVGLRGVTQSRRVPAHCFTENDIVTTRKPGSRKGPAHGATAGASTPEASLAVFPAQSNFCGHKYPLSWVSALRDGDADITLRPFVGSPVACDEESGPRQWRILLDAAALVSTSPLDLAAVAADFVALSFYKMFGLPTVSVWSQSCFASVVLPC